MDFNFDLGAVDTRTLSEAGVRMDVRRLDGTLLVNSKGDIVSLHLRGPDSASYAACTREQVKKRVQRSSAGQPTTPEEDDTDAIEVLAKLTIGWTGILDKAGEPIACSVDAARALYTNFPVIRDQADAFAAARRNFTKG